MFLFLHLFAFYKFGISGRFFVPKYKLCSQTCFLWKKIRLKSNYTKLLKSKWAKLVPFKHTVKFDYIIRQFQNLQSHVKMYLHGKNSFPLTSSFLQSKSHQNRHWKCHQKIHYFQSRTAFSVLKSLQNLMKMYLHGSHSYPLQKISSGSEGFFCQQPTCFN